MIGVSSANAAETVQHVNVETPAVGEVVTQTIGSTIYEHSNYSIVTQDVLIPEGEMTKGWIAWRATIPAGTKLVIVPHDKAIKACAPGLAHNTIGGQYTEACAYDDDRDGTFDRINAAGGSAGKVPRTAYSRSTQQTSVAGNGFKNVLIFNGYSKGTIKLDYREFLNDLARPAFTQELEFDVSELPTVIAVKSVRIRILSVSNEGLKFERL
ncbi:hypothetical protein GRI40_04425 [Altererythrobacter aerius]|uniref:Uncharacterized protein n=1 Tax=Tsuneonella aeria TaxID=1837929 RepID=A0A6I4TDL5_9SPHN|nr:hypothetical protein [Tsuneonella aeria]MXO74468.1 hypothetical protein [Tsuneonella aeria]